VATRLEKEKIEEQKKQRELKEKHKRDM